MKIHNSYALDQESCAARLQDEISLLQAMYPDQVCWNGVTKELSFTCQHGGSGITAAGAGFLLLRLPDDYLAEDGSMPSVIRAQDCRKEDLRQEVVKRYRELDLKPGSEILDQIIIDFERLIKEENPGDTDTDGEEMSTDHNNSNRGITISSCKTVVIWLHHLLATGKRKLALNPTISAHGKAKLAQRISGVTKPGYPGILVFTGPCDLVDSHVAELRNQRWQAFQIRFEETHDEEKLWQFQHGQGIREVESMSQVASAIQGAPNQDTFLRAAGVK